MSDRNDRDRSVVVVRRPPRITMQPIVLVTEDETAAEALRAAVETPRLARATEAPPVEDNPEEDLA